MSATDDRTSSAAYTVRRWWFRVWLLLMVSPFIVGLWSALR